MWGSKSRQRSNSTEDVGEFVSAAVSPAEADEIEDGFYHAKEENKLRGQLSAAKVMLLQTKKDNEALKRLVKYMALKWERVKPEEGANEESAKQEVNSLYHKMTNEVSSDQYFMTLVRGDIAEQMTKADTDKLSSLDKLDMIRLENPQTAERDRLAYNADKMWKKIEVQKNKKREGPSSDYPSPSNG